MESVDVLVRHKILFGVLCLIAVLLVAFIINWIVSDRYTFEYTAYGKIDMAEVVTLETECIRVMNGGSGLEAAKAKFIKDRGLTIEVADKLLVSKGCESIFLALIE